MSNMAMGTETATDAEKAYQLIKSKIISLEFPPGSPINQLALMDELGVSRTPVREALKRLEYENLVIAIYRRGMSVAEIGLSDLRHVYEIRLELESACARLAAQKATDEQIQLVEKKLEELLNTDFNERRLVAERERQLHALISECSHSPFLIQESHHYYGLALRIWYFLIDRLPPGSDEISFHKRLVDAIRSRDDKLAEQLMRDHVKSAFDTVKAHL